jgi:hypothetical protein
MLPLTPLKRYKKHLKESYFRLLETSNDYRFIDENKSDSAAFKAMKILEKINRIRYLDGELQSFS